ncbi:indole-3-glycerol phosphate synthase TrpC [Fibrella forsythiae]|uniref:Indole-3-glycerol phosphate synthase n=1 Tax=Fibrella forsythiae TaxID=2817061 RepID=A0ABS3JLD1_9BACT|nr:indole-3-glycerol phosphate synthase TrpC [Fibrella forsythiae]MBO0950191.1 indole-3-glycerol phosphate synthase TrpC [Fibrella forsythiae]
MTILDTIVARKRDEIAARKAAISANDLRNMPLFDRSVNSARASILATDSTGIISEFKRKSPSKGIINDQVDVAETTRGYVAAGAAVLSVLTDEPFFGGTPADLQAARTANPHTPILRKDFVVDTYQLLEAKAWGADLVLLIASCLSPEQVRSLSEYAHELGMEVLLEVHDAEELQRSLCESVDLVGVNNRNLKTFVTDIDTSVQLAGLIPDQYVKVTESGLHDAATMVRLQEAGYQAFLIGEAFMKTDDPATALRQLVTDYKEQLVTSKNSHQIV